MRIRPTPAPPAGRGTGLPSGENDGLWERNGVVLRAACCLASVRYSDFTSSIDYIGGTTSRTNAPVTLAVEDISTLTPSG